MKRLWFAVLALVLATLACGESNKPIPTPAQSAFADGHVAMGFFPTPPKVSIWSVLRMFSHMADHADVVMVQEPLPWEDFVESPDAASQALDDMRNLVRKAAENGMEAVFVLDPLNGLDRREFQNIPASWGAVTFADARVRAAFRNYAVRVAREFRPRYLGLASEINTYMATYPDDAAHFLSLYRETYAAVKAVSPDTQVFVTFQWDQLRFPDGIQQRGEQPVAPIQWQVIEAFEPQLDVWVISSYPCLYFGRGEAIPADYYTPLRARTEKPLAVGEGGCASESLGDLPGSPESQSAYLHALDDQLGDRLVFWIYLLYNDLDTQSYANVLQGEGRGDDVDTLTWFVTMGLTDTHWRPKPSLTTWDAIRARR